MVISLQSVFGDSAFKKYHGQFGKPKGDDITSSMYNCQSYYSSSRRDTTDTDSASISHEEIILDEDGNIRIVPNEGAKHESTPTNEKDQNQRSDKQNKKNKEQVVNFEQL